MPKARSARRPLKHVRPLIPQSTFTWELGVAAQDSPTKQMHTTGHSQSVTAFSTAIGVAHMERIDSRAMWPVGAYDLSSVVLSYPSRFLLLANALAFTGIRGRVELTSPLLP